MSKIFVNPSAIRAGLADLEMAEETVDLINRNVEDNQAHLQGEPIEVEALPEDMRRLHISEQKHSQLSDSACGKEEGSDDDFYMADSEDPYVPMQSYLDNVGIQIVKKMKTGERFFKIWSQAVEEIISYVTVNFPLPSGKSTDDKSTQTVSERSRQNPQPSSVKKEDQLSKTKVVSQEASGPPALEWSATNDEDDASVEAEIAHQIAESFSKKYKFPSRSSGIFLYNFEQLKTNLDDIVREAKRIPGVMRLAQDGLRLPLRCILGWVASTHSKRFQILVDSDKLSKIMQDDINRYLAY
ncbi:phosphoprotein [Lyssavirus khujand]|uniref:Phosphoprotein n=4 Tax=Khujand virus TaxID=237716 RepID=PHOSP_KHUV|nr:phosphoprotein [Lyssavirus khujand]Q6X1D3.1 RecName: Full=Phosphoprotein; Short=Protein P; AltName: Full=Protein M1 [Lyssavirus khujand]AAP86777.1 phosphoprotein [Lyssavirus khujand]